MTKKRGYFRWRYRHTSRDRKTSEKTVSKLKVGCDDVFNEYHGNGNAKEMMQ